MTDTSIRSLKISATKSISVSPAAARLAKQASLIVAVILVVVVANTLLSRRSTMLRQASTDSLATQRITSEYETARLVPSSSVASSLAKADAALPAKRDQAGFISDINAAASSAGVTWSSGTQQTVAPSAASRVAAAVPTSAKAYQLSLNASGSQAQVLAFIQALQQMPRVTTLTSISLTWAKTTVTATIALVVYSR